MATEHWTVTISSGKGDDRVRHAATIQSSIPGEMRHIPLEDLFRCIEVLRAWAAENYPGRKFVVMATEYGIHLYDKCAS